MPEHSARDDLRPPVRLSERWQWGSKQPISFLMEQAVQNPSVISLAAGLVDQTTLPDTEVRTACAALLADEVDAVLTRAFGRAPGVRANDGVVPLRSQLWGRIAWAGHADHLDVLGHFGDLEAFPEAAGPQGPVLGIGPDQQKCRQPKVRERPMASPLKPP